MAEEDKGTEEGKAPDTEGKTEDKSQTDEGKSQKKETKPPEKQKTWQELLAEFSEDGDDDDKGGTQKQQTKDDDKKPPETKEPPKLQLPQEMQELLSFARNEMASRNRRELTADLKKFDEGLNGVSDDLLQAVAVGMIALDEKLETAFQERDQHPRRWSTVGKALAAQLNEQFGNLGKARTGDGEEQPDESSSQASARAAARTTDAQRRTADSARKEEDQKVMNMTPSQRLAHWEKQGIRLGI